MQKKIPTESWKNSFLLDQVFGSTIANFNLFTKKVQSKVNFVMNKFKNENESKKN